MTNPGSTGVDPQLVARLASRFDSLGDHMRQVAVDLDVLRSQLTVPQAPPAPYAPYAPAPHAPATCAPATPAPAYQGRPGPPFPTPPRPPVRATAPKEPWWQRDGVISRVLAVAGAGVTIVGVVMLLVLAAQAGWFGPELRVGAGALLSIGLLAAGSRVFGRPGGRVGGIALAATGIAGLYLDILAVTVVYEWLEPTLGLVIAFGIAAAGVAVAVSWTSQPMAVLILLGVAVCAPVLTDGISLTLIAFLTATYVASFPAQLGRDWPALHAARLVPVVLALLIAIAMLADSRDSSVSVLALAGMVAVFSASTSAELLRRNISDGVATAALGLGAVPILVSGAMTERWTTVAVQAAVAIGCAVMVFAVRALPVAAQIVLGLVGALALFHAAMVGASLDARPTVLLVIAAAFLAMAYQSQERASESRAAFVLAAAFGAAGALAFLVISPPSALVDSYYAVGDVGVVIGGVLLAAVALGLVRIGTDTGIVKQNLQVFWIVSGLVVLYAATAATVALGTGIGGTETGFVAGQTVATIEWMAAAFALLALGLRNEKFAHTALLAGLLLTAASISKLFLFDLVALDGLFRVVAFIIVGILLLVAGTRYASAFAERDAATPRT